MREFVYYSKKARTSGNIKDPMKAGRIDIVFNAIISAFFLSNKMRENVHLHLIFNGPPNPPMHLELISNRNMPISKKNILGLIKRMLYKCNKKKKKEIFPGCFIEKKSLNKVLEELKEQGKKICILDSKGENIRKTILDNCVFIIGDHEGLPKKEIKRFKDKISIGKKIYFSSQTFIIIHNELDLRE